MRAFFITIFWLSTVACKDNVAQPLLSNVDNKKVVQDTNLFERLIGRAVGNGDKDLLAKLKAKTYEQKVDIILHSEQFYREGFWYLHKQRLLPGEISAASSSAERKLKDSLALKLELEDVARQDNYWEILTYHDRWLHIGDNFDFPYACAKMLLAQQKADDTSDYISDCSKSLKQSKPPKCHTNTAGKYVCLEFRCQTNDEGEEVCSEVKCESNDKGEEVCVEVTSKQEEQVATGEEVYTKLIEFISDNFFRDISADSNFPFVTKLEAAVAWHEINGNNPQKRVFVDGGSKNPSFIKLKVPASMQGVHASPLWLSTHFTSETNLHLHRARVIYYSWFCEGISPDQATKSNKKTPQAEIDHFKPYLPQDDRHASADSNCFGCHKMIQPLANYFGRMSTGVDYNKTESLRNIEDVNAFFHINYEEDDTKLPLRNNIGAGYYLGNDEKGEPEFFKQGHNPAGGTAPSMADLAALLTRLPKVKRCVIRYTWNKIFGCEARLSEKELSEATNYFASNANFRALLAYLLKTAKATTYFTEKDGAATVQAQVAAEEESSMTCADANTAWNGHTGENYNIENKGASIIEGVCETCHHTEGLFSDSSKLPRVYMRSNSTQQGAMMPLNNTVHPAISGLDNALAVQRKVFRCFIEDKAQQENITLPLLPACVADSIDLQKIHEVGE